MSHKQWTAVDRFIDDNLVASDAALDRALKTSAAAGLPPIAVTPSQGKLLNLLARAICARTILELGTLGGYSTIWLARALAPGGRLVTLEANTAYAQVAATNITAAGLSDIVDVRTGNAHETLPELAAEKPDPFDLVFIDADKQSSPDYFTWALALSRPGSLIITDNVIRDGAVIDADSDDPSALGSRRLHALLGAEQRVSATTIQTVGAKGYDGFTLALVLS